MEAQGGGIGGGEVRRLHIIYFLSRKGRSEHPHLIRVHHINRNGVRLRDVKRWLSELRGKNMPESFTWSYKRKYKTGCIWQDLLDEDLITPISDNEYVLKGSEICSSPFIDEYGEKKASMQKKAPQEVEPNVQNVSLKKAMQESSEIPLSMSTKPSSEIEEESPPFSSETSTQTDDSMKAKEKKQRVRNKQDRMPQQNDKLENHSSFYSLFNRKNKKKTENIYSENISTPGSLTSPCSFTKSRSYSSGASNMFRNLISCGGIDTNDSAMVVLNRNRKSSIPSPTKKPQSNDTSEIFQGDRLGGSTRTSGATWDQQSRLCGRFSFDGGRSSTKSKKESNHQKTISAAYRPINNPICSQCGKQFKPEKLHTHMKTCKGMKAKGMKALAKGVTHTAFIGADDDDKTQRRLTDCSYKNPISGCYLTNN